MTDSTGLSRRTLSEQVGDLLVDYIAANGLRPGDRLPSESELVERFQVSRPIVREGIRVLHGRKIITVSAGRVPVVNDSHASMLTPYFRHVMQVAEATPLEILDARSPIEVELAGRAAESRNDEDLRSMGTALNAMAAALSDPSDYSRHDADFHVAVARVSQSVILFHIVESMHEALEIVSEQGLQRRSTIEELQAVQNLHEAIFDAVSSQNPAMARGAMARHFEEARKYLQEEAQRV